MSFHWSNFDLRFYVFLFLNILVKIDFKPLLLMILNYQ